MEEEEKQGDNKKEAPKIKIIIITPTIRTKETIVTDRCNKCEEDSASAE